MSTSGNTSGKPFFPAKWFYRRHQYPRKNCLGCGAPLVPKIYHTTSGPVMETPNRFKVRLNCDSSCYHRSLLTRGQPAPLNTATVHLLAQALREHPDLLEAWPKS